MFDVECKRFPDFSNDKTLLDGKSCHMIEKYNGKQISASVLKKHDEFVIKIADRFGNHIDPMDAGEISDSLKSVMQICNHLSIDKYQLFFYVSDGAILTDVFNGSEFISAGMLNDIFSKRIKTQKITKTEKYDKNIRYDAVIKPSIMCYDRNKNPAYLIG